MAVRVIKVDEIPEDKKAEGEKQIMNLKYIHSLSIGNRK